ncbi:MAG TPA: DNA (cytosine-5-)-methyltransferase [Candidatus Acidoferrales bacterium]|nr:DNA (cytosine-5-)-methyltransferase [Candidatus Acidoferrales bacterium]
MSVALPTKNAVSAVDVFCGVGGLTHGLQKEGITVWAGVDIDPKCRYPYEKNNGCLFVEEDVAMLSGLEVASFFPVNHTKILVGCAPCQPFSTYTRGKKERKLHKWGLLSAFGRIIREADPDIVSMENVPQLEKEVIFKRFVTNLRSLGYSVTYSNVNCWTYGVPQTRTRLVLFASKYGEISLVTPTHSPNRRRTVRQAIGRLEPIKAGGISMQDTLHRASALSPRNLRRIRASKPGGTWRDWTDDLVADCHKAETGETYPGVYGRMVWDRPAPTVTTQCHGFGNGRFGHPEQNRAISLREAALLQTFPRRYRFAAPDDPITFHHLGKLIGNAVPVRLGRIIGRSILKHLEAQSDR